MNRFALKVAYHGFDFAGWQKQKAAPSVQQSIEQALELLTGKVTPTVAAGRTDAGVHAYGQVIHFDLDKQWSGWKLRDALNAYLRGQSINIIEAVPTGDDFHARFSAIARQYHYRILDRRPPCPIRQGYLWHFKNSLDISLIQEGAEYLMGVHDFTSFRASRCQALSPIKSLDYINIDRVDDEIHVSIKARSFLHHQVRNIVGSLKQVGIKKHPPLWIKQVLEGKDRRLAGATAPPQGLYLVAVDYPQILFTE